MNTMTAKQICKTAAFLLTGILLFFAVQWIFMPKQAEHRSTAEKLEGLYSLQEDCLDAVFLGTSVVDRGISPMKIYEDTGICTYNLGTSAQPIQSSYFLLRETLKTQSPKVVFLEVSVLFQNKMNTSFYKILMDNLYGTATGLEMARLYGSMEEKGLLSGLIPMVSYHTRWSELSRKDFCPDEKTANYTMGYTPNAKISRITPAFETIYQSQTDAFLEDREKNYPEVSSWVPEYFDSILTLCTEHNARLILLKSPGFRSPYDNGWSLWKREVAADLADTHGLTFSGHEHTGSVRPADRYL